MKTCPLRAPDWIHRYRPAVLWEDLEREQTELLAQIRHDPAQKYLLLAEPSPTFTTGRSGVASDLLWNPAELRRRGIRCETVSRGGKWTFHGPGQLLLYPLVSLPTLGFRRREVIGFLGALRRGTVGFLESLGVPIDPESRAVRKPFGIYVDGSKLVSFGICLRDGICSHGLALYLRDQTDYFRGIQPCGVPGQKMTSLEQLGVSLAWGDAAGRLAESVEKSFKTTKS